MKFLLCAASIASLSAVPAFAQAQDTPAPVVQPADDQPGIDPEALSGDSLMIGAGAGIVPSYEGSDDYIVTVVPGVRGRVSGINFTLRGNRFSADLIPTSGGPGWDFQAGPVAQLNFNRSSGIVDDQVKLLPKIGPAVELGGYVGVGKQGLITSDYDKLTLSLAYVHDVGSVHGSYVITPSIDYGTPLSTKAFVGINFSGDYMGEGYADTYYSISSAGSSASGLPAFSAHKGWKDWTIGSYFALSLTGDLTHGISLIGAASYRRLLDEAAASPVTSVAGSRDQWIGMAGLAYTF